MKLSWKTCFKIIVTVLLLVISIMLLPRLGGFALNIVSAAVPIIIGCVLAFIVNIVMNLYEKIYFPWWAKSKFVKITRRPVCLTLAYLTILFVLALIFSLIIPQLIECVVTIVELIIGYIENIPALYGKAVEFINAQQIFHNKELLEFLNEKISGTLNEIDWQSIVSKLTQFLTSGIGMSFNVVTVVISSTFNIIVTALIALIFSGYLLISKERLAKQYNRIMERYVKPAIKEKADYLLSVLNTSCRQYIIGQCTEAVILGVLCTIGMWIFKMPYATMIGPVIGFTALIPIAGAYIGAAVGAFMILTVDPLKALLFIVYIIVLQQLEGNIIYPRVVGSQLGLPGMWVLAAVTIGGGVMGIMGMLISVPIAAAIYRILNDDLDRHEALNMQTNDSNTSDTGGESSESDTAEPEENVPEDLITEITEEAEANNA